MMFKSFNNLGPVNLQDLFNKRSTNYNLRNSCGKLPLPKPRTNYVKRSFSYSRAQLWNSIPQDVGNIKSVGQFKREINRLFQSCKTVNKVYIYIYIYIYIYRGYFMAARGYEFYLRVLKVSLTSERSERVRDTFSTRR